MARTAAWIRALVGTLLLPCALGVADAGDAPADAGGPQKALRARVREWCEARVRVAYECDRCHGDGIIETEERYGLLRRAIVRRPCPNCGQTGARLNEKKAEEVFVGSRSPAGRRDPA